MHHGVPVPRDEFDCEDRDDGMHHGVPVPRDEFDCEELDDDDLPSDAALQWAVDQLPDSIETAKVRAALAGAPWLGLDLSTGKTAAQRLRNASRKVRFQGPPLGGWKASRV